MKVGISFEAARATMLKDKNYHFKESSDSCYGIDKENWDKEVEGVLVVSTADSLYGVTDNPASWLIPKRCTKELNEHNNRGE